MEKRIRRLLLSLAALVAAHGAWAGEPASALALAEGSALRACDEDRLLVVTFLAVECPLARVYASRLNELARRFQGQSVGFMAVDSNDRDQENEIAEFAGCLDFPLDRDEAHRLADVLGATRSPEVFLLDAQRHVVYRGRIDDQYAPGTHGRSAPTRSDLAEAIDETLASRTVTVAATEAVGCVIDRGSTEPAAVVAEGSDSVTYSRDVAAVFDRHCVTCHRPGGAAPFSLATYQDAVAWAETVREVVEQRRMPPWGVRGGDFVNDVSLSDRQRALLFAWLDAGLPEGDPAERPAPPVFSDDWSIRADRVVSMSEPFRVPATGVLDYQEFALDPGFVQDTWISAVEIRPGCRDVVHHINVYAKPKHARPEELFVNELGNYYLAMCVPGNTVTVMPPGTAKLVPAGWQIVLSVHYVPRGIERDDRSSVAMTLCEPAQVQRELATRAVLDDHLLIGPNERKTVTHSWTCEDDFTLFALYPHMHLRGRSMLFSARYPDGREAVLLDVARYDFAWQYRYVLRTPISLPRGTLVTASAVYDNTADNPNNPDPSAVVRAGRQTTDEMFQACFEICRTAEDRLAAPLGGPLAKWPPAIVLVCGAAGIALVAGLVSRHRGRAGSRMLQESSSATSR